MRYRLRLTSIRRPIQLIASHPSRQRRESLGNSVTLDKLFARSSIDKFPFRMGFRKEVSIFVRLRFQQMKTKRSILQKKESGKTGLTFLRLEQQNGII